MSRNLFLVPLLVGCALAGGCTQQAMPVRKHSASRGMVPPPAPSQVTLISAELPLRMPDRLPQEVLRPTIAAIRPFEEWTDQEVAADAIGRIGAAAVPELQRSLRSPDPRVRFQATEVLARVGSDAKPAVPDLIELLDDEDPLVRRAAARTLGRIGPEAADAVPALMRTLLQPKPLPPE